MPRDYNRIYVPVDSSGHSFAAIDLAVDLAAKFDASIVGSHVIAAGTSDSYLDLLEECCRNASVPFERKTLDGRSHRAIAEDIRESGYGLVVMGALGSGAVGDSQIGSVAERVVRRTRADLLIVKDLLPDPDGPVLAAVDGSDLSLDALRASLEFARATGRDVEAIIVGETGVAGAASSAVEATRAAASSDGHELEITVAEGKPFDRILHIVRERRPWLLAIGKTGSHCGEGDDAVVLGSTTSNLLRLAPCNMLVTGGAAIESVPGRQGEVATPAPVEPVQRMLRWTEDAERLLEDVPSEQRFDVIRTVEEGARRMGVTVITAETIDKVMLGYIDS